MSEHDDTVRFGPFRLDVARRILSRGNVPVPLSSRAFEILRLLVEHRDRVMTKDEIITHVWRGLAVEENNLAVQVSALRRALGESELDEPLILTVPGHGYRFVGRVTSLGTAAPVDAGPPAMPKLPPNVADRFVDPRLDAHRVTAWRWRTASAVLTVTLIGCAVLFMMMRSVAPPPAAIPAPPRLSLAVLPFRDLSDCNCWGRMADAVTDDLTTDLSHFPNSRVTSRESANVYRDTPASAPEVGRALNVRYLLEGHIRAESDGFSINAQLIEAATDQHLWAQSFTVESKRFGGIEDAIRREIASILGVQLDQIEGAASRRERGGDPDALDLFFQARYILDHSSSLEAMTRAQLLLAQATARQPDFADGVGELAWVLARKVHDGTDPDFSADLDRAHRIGAQALKLAPNGALALAARGLLLSGERQWKVARESLQAALAAEPDSVPVRSALISCLSRLGLYTEQVRQIEDLLRIDPEGPETRLQYYHLGAAYVMLGNAREGLTWLTRYGNSEPAPETDVDPQGVADYAWLYRIAALQLIGDQSAARAEFARYDNVRPNRTAWQFGAFLTRAQAALPGASQFVAALVQSGMPLTLPEDMDWHVGVPDRITRHGPFDPTPTRIDGAGIIDTTDLAAALRTGEPIRIINVGSRAVTLKGTLLACRLDWEQPDSVQDCAHMLMRDSGSGRVVVMGLGVTDWNSYNGALALAAAGVPRVAWYRGGEESWQAAHLPADDMRD